MSAVKAATASPILAIHARYEAAWQEYNQIDVAGTKLDKSDADDDLLGFKYQRAETANNADGRAPPSHPLPSADHMA